MEIAAAAYVEAVNLAAPQIRYCSPSPTWQRSSACPERDRLTSAASLGETARVRRSRRVALPHRSARQAPAACASTKPIICASAKCPGASARSPGFAARVAEVIAETRAPGICAAARAASGGTARRSATRSRAARAGSLRSPAERSDTSRKSSRAPRQPRPAI